MKNDIIYEATGITNKERKAMKRFAREMEKIDSQRSKLSPAERAKQDKELADLHSRMQAGIEE
jgi:hypothetical protein